MTESPAQQSPPSRPASGAFRRIAPALFTGILLWMLLPIVLPAAPGSSDWTAKCSDALDAVAEALNNTGLITVKKEDLRALGEENSPDLYFVPAMGSGCAVTHAVAAAAETSPRARAALLDNGWEISTRGTVIEASKSLRGTVWFATYSSAQSDGDHLLVLRPQQASSN